MYIGPIENHRGREAGTLVYPVYSRRSQGLSLGINLFPDHKQCSFDCPYCEVFPFEQDIRFSVADMEQQLLNELVRVRKQGIPVRDICFSGNGEPSCSSDFPRALEAAARIRDASAPEASLVLITNGTGLFNDHTFELLCRAASQGLKIWLKLDAGTPAWYALMARSAVSFERLILKIKEAVGRAPVTIQTMLCMVQGTPPPAAEAAAWERLVVELAGIGAAAGQGIEAIQIYGKARPAPQDPLAEALPVAYLEARAASLIRALRRFGPANQRGAIPVQVFP
ncbi:MAG: radical SAM protein [Treponema sp.]|jgi:histidinol dehydrogenase|nr:radical SAM protein [Treponema sp.]